MHLIMVKERDEDRKAKCAICWQPIRPKSPLLRGMKCMRFEIKQKLEYLLPPQDFRDLYDEHIFRNPRICNVCFVTIKKIPRTISRLQDLVGKKINTKLYKPHRVEWNEFTSDESLTRNRTHGLILSQGSKNVSSRQHRVHLFSEVVNTPSVGKDRFDQARSKETTKSSRHKSPEPLNEIECESDNDATFSYSQNSEDHYSSCDLSQSDSASKSVAKAFEHDSLCDDVKKKRNADLPSKPESVDRDDHLMEIDPILSSSISTSDDVTPHVNNKRKTMKKRTTVMKSLNKTKQTSVASIKAVKNESWSRRPRRCKENCLNSKKESKSNRLNTSNLLQKEEKSFNIQRKTKQSVEDKSFNVQQRTKQYVTYRRTRSNVSEEKETTLQKTRSNVSEEKEITLQRTRSHVIEEKEITLQRTRCNVSEEKESSDCDHMTDISYSQSEDEYLPPVTRRTTRTKESVNYAVHKKNVKVSKLSQRISAYKVCIETAKNRKKTKSRQLTIKLKALKSKRFKRDKNKRSDYGKGEGEASQLQVKSDAARTSVKVDIPASLSEHSKTRLKELVEEVTKYLHDRKDSLSRRMLIKCSIGDCDHLYPQWYHMAVHVKYYHYDGVAPDGDYFSQQMFMLAENDELDGETFPFKCRHTDCSLAFTSEENLQEHESVHGTENLLMCGFPDCTKAFKIPRSLHVHFRAHTGERPFFCTKPGCEKSFKDRKELSKHRSRHTGEKPFGCDIGGCDKTFFTISELNCHMSTHEKCESLCCDACGKQYANEKGLLRHKRRIHGVGKPGRHICPYEDCTESFVKKEKLEIHLCSHSPECRLFCEKCGKKFSCQRYLDVHYKIHMKNEKHAMSPPSRSIQCEFPDCDKMFTTRENMKSHVLNQHRGRKPKAVPGVFFPCVVEGCGKKFSFRSTLYRHNKLVHKGGDYKLGREVVKYMCKFEGCSKEFNRKNLLEEHMVMEHGKAPKRLLPLQNKELDFIEKICVHCGMALTAAQLPRHIEIYHSDRAIREMKESLPYCCHLKDCDQIFSTQADRKSHVQEHINNPPFRCLVGDCGITFFLEKNLDNHLWNHSKKISICDYEGCGRKFEDQLQLAKHSKCHYDGKMKCPWPNCDNWLTETGHLKPHFIAHSRSLRANLDSDFVCEICELAFNSKWGLMIHKRMHGEEAAAKPSLSRLVKFACEEDGCQATFSDQKGFFDHFLFHYTNIPASCNCNGCTESFRNMITMSRHTKSHFDGKYKCPWQGCAKLFASMFIVKKHLYRHIMSSPVVASNRLYSCTQCFMVFKSESNHFSHQEYHNEKSDYVCPTCGKKGHHNHMKNHRSGNKPRKPQECQQCGARYNTISGLKFHLLQKHKIGNWPFQCMYCGKGFVSSREMQRHIPLHTKEKPFRCEICGASFASHTGHRAHMRKHTGEKYACDVEGCGKVYTTPISLRGHKAQHAGFSKTCHYCFKIYKNPYRHKCKASRESKLKIAKLDHSQNVRPSVSLMAPVLSHQPPAPPPQHSQPSMVSLAPAMIPASTTLQHTVILPQDVVSHTLEVQQAARTIMAPNTLTHSHVMPHGFVPGIAQGLSQGMQQVLPHGLTGQGMMQQDRGQPGPMDMTRGASMDLTGDYTFSNYVVFWDSQNNS